MNIYYDVVKSEKNRRERGLPFDRAHEFDWDSAIYAEDLRKDYPEKRYVAMGFLYGRLHVLCFTPLEDGVRIISFRKANLREVKRYEKETPNNPVW